MKLHKIAIVALISFPLSVFNSWHSFSLAQSEEITISCQEYQGNPSTVATTPDSVKPIVVWVDTVGGYSPDERCTSASINFQKYLIFQGMEKVVVENRGGLAVVCASGVVTSCDGYLFTTTWEDAESIRRSLGNLPWYFNTPVYQGDSSLFSFNLMDYIRSGSDLGSDIFPLSQ